MNKLKKCNENLIVVVFRYNNTMIYDIAIIGAGINGTTLSYMLRKKGVDVALFDTKIAGGGSGAAGAFLSPKFSKSGELKRLINSALDEAFTFYETGFAEFIEFYPLLHIAKDEKEAQALRLMKKNGEIPLLDDLPFTPKNEFIYTSKSAIVDAQAMCEALAKGSVFIEKKVNGITHKGEFWSIDGVYKAKKIVLATGAYKHLIDEPYLRNAIRGIWGHRIDIKTSTTIPCSIHQYLSISPTRGGISALGATHDVHFHPEDKVVYDYEKGREELLQNASKTIALSDVEVIKDYVGLRSGSFDYLPFIGELVDSETTFKRFSKTELMRKPTKYETFSYYKDLYVINGSAGYGFVLAPFLARVLSEAIVEKKEIPDLLKAARFFPRYVRRNF